MIFNIYLLDNVYKMKKKLNTKNLHQLHSWTSTSSYFQNNSRSSYTQQNHKKYINYQSTKININFLKMMDCAGGLCNSSDNTVISSPRLDRQIRENGGPDNFLLQVKKFNYTYDS